MKRREARPLSSDDNKPTLRGAEELDLSALRADGEADFSRVDFLAAHQAPQLLGMLASHERGLEVATPGGRVGAVLFTAPRPRAMLVWANPSGIARLLSSQRSAARLLAQAGFTTLLVDLLTEAEDEVRDGVHDDVPRLAERLLCAADWLSSRSDSCLLPLGYLGAGSAAPAALVAAAVDPRQVFALVLCGGRFTPASASLMLTQIPTLFIVGRDEPDTLASARKLCRLRARRQLAIVPAETSGSRAVEPLDRITSLSKAWFSSCLGPL